MGSDFGWVKYVSKTLLILSSVLLVSCNELKQEKEKYIQDSISIENSSVIIDTIEKIISDEEEDTTTKPTALYSKITSQTKIKVLTAEKIIDTLSPHYKESYDDLNNWKLNKKQIVSILHQSKEIDWHEWHYLYQNSPVQYKGKISIDNREAYFKIEAGAVSWIEFADTSIFLGYRNNDYRKYFFRW